MLYGTKQNATPRSVLGVINDIAQDKSIIIGDIEITNKFTFFDVYADQAEKIQQAFEAAGEPLSIAEPREVVSKAPKAQSEKTQRNRERDRRRDNDDRRSRDRRGDRDDYRSDRRDRGNRRDNRRNEVVENPDKPWRRRR
jgi:hypothetical protein